MDKRVCIDSREQITKRTRILSTAIADAYNQTQVIRICENRMLSEYLLQLLARPWPTTAQKHFE